ncbi:MAG: glycosyltransferase family 25 protein [Rhizobiaceae bacterium]|nr:glycosyltransferase family 25 protein [Rhizobiaceae bacterium]
MKCYLINLDRSPERYNWFLESTAKLNLDIIRVVAIDGNRLPASEIASLQSLRSGYFDVAKGEIGCFLSHRNVWQFISDGDEEWSFVAEDDIHFSGGCGKFFDNDNWLPTDADLVKAETTLKVVDISYIKKVRVFGRGVGRLNSHHGGSGGYFLSKKTAKRLLKMTEFMCDPVDQVLFNPELGVSNGLNTYQIDPALCIQDSMIKGSSHFRGLESLLDEEREGHLHSKVRMRGFAKIWREILRLFRKARNFIRVYIINLSVSKTVYCPLQEQQDIESNNDREQHYGR